MIDTILNTIAIVAFGSMIVTIDVKANMEIKKGGR